MTRDTFDYIWDQIIVEYAKNILLKDGIEFDDARFDEKRDAVKNEYDNLRGYSKFAYLKDPDGLSNRYLVSTYFVLAIAKIRPLDLGKSEGKLKNEQLAVRAGIWVLGLFRRYQSGDKNNTVHNGLWSENRLGELLDYLGDFVDMLYNHLYYDINDRIYSILEMSNMIWMIESYIDTINALEKKRNEERLEGNKDEKESIICWVNQLNGNRIITKKESRNLDLIWDNVWVNKISKVAIEIVNRNKGRAVFDRTSKYIILNEYLSLLNKSKDNYITISGVGLDKYMITACFIFAVAKSQPLRYRYDIHAKKGIYNENLALEAGLSLLYEFTDGDPKRTHRYAFPEPFHNKTFKELICLMLHYDIRENKYSILAIANILFMIDLYTGVRTKEYLNGRNQTK